MPEIWILSVIVRVRNSEVSARQVLTVVSISYKTWNLGATVLQNKVLNRRFFLLLNRKCGFSTVWAACNPTKETPFYPTKLTLRNNCRNSKLMTCHFSDLGVLLIGWFIPQTSFRRKTRSRLTQHQCTL